MESRRSELARATPSSYSTDDSSPKHQDNVSFLYDTSRSPGLHHGFSLLRDEETLLGLDSTNFIPNRRILFLDIVGSSNGLVCLSLLEAHQNQRDIIVWNPATKQFKYLPKPPVTIVLDNYNPMLGFGVTGDLISGYKVVRIYRTYRKENLSIIVHRALVFTQSTCSWREAIPGAASSFGETDSSITWITLKGVMYWLAGDKDRFFDHVSSFHLGDEVFNAVALPSYLRLQCNNTFDLVSWKNSLAIYSSTLGEFWVMTAEEYEEMHWTKQFTLDFSGLGASKRFIGVWKHQFLFSGEVAYVESQVRSLCLYDPTSQEVTKLSKLEAKRYVKAVDYVESRVPV